MKGEVPPETVTVAVPLAAPTQSGLVPEAEAVKGTGSVMVTEAVAVHPLASVTVTECVPAERATAGFTVSPSSHR